MRQPEKEKLPEKEEGELQKEEAHPNSADLKPKDERKIEFHDPSEYYV